MSKQRLKVEDENVILGAITEVVMVVVAACRYRAMYQYTGY